MLIRKLQKVMVCLLLAGNINMKNYLNIKYEEQMIHVTDDWHPCFEGNKVRLKLSLNYYNGKYYAHLSAWGKSDTGVKMCKESLSKETIEEEYNRLFVIYMSVPYIADRQWFLDRGFVPA